MSGMARTVLHARPGRRTPKAGAIHLMRLIESERLGRVQALRVAATAERPGRRSRAMAGYIVSVLDGW